MQAVTIGSGDSQTDQDRITRRRLLGAISAGAVVSSALAVGRLSAQPGITDDTTWNLGDLYPDPASWEKAFKAVQSSVAALPQLRHRFGDSAEALGAVLRAISQARRTAERVVAYAELSADADLHDSGREERRQRANDLDRQLNEATSWVEPAVLGLGNARVTKLLASRPELEPFRFGLQDILRRSSNARSADAEEVLAAAGPVISAPQAIYQQVAGLPLPAATLTLADGTKATIDDDALGVLGSADRVRSKAVYDAYWARAASKQEAFGATLNASIRGDLLEARVHRYDSVLAARLGKPNIPLDVFNMAAAETERGLVVLHQYYDWRRRAAGLPDLHMPDLFRPVSSFSRKFTIAEMRNLMLSAVAPLGRDYQAKLAAATSARWMDTAPRPGKRPGNYTNFTIYDVHPYLLLNMGQKFNDLTLFTHEWGHAMHSVLANGAQPYELARYPVFLAEIASTHNEVLLSRFMIDHASTREEKLFYIARLLQFYVIVFFNNAMLTAFEGNIHQTAEHGEGLSGQGMTDTYAALQRRFYGPGVTIEPIYGIQWTTIPQFYDAFYSFQYVTAVTAATHFSDAVLTGDVGARDRYLGLLRAGGSDYGYKLVREAGVDLARPEPYRALIARFAAVLKEAEAI